MPSQPNRLVDPQRPGYHFLPAANWMNDPNGLIQWRGQYHLFYQYNPNGAFDATKHWGHALSADLLHWQELPLALAPTPGGPDAEGCWSGCAVDDGGVPTFIYTGVHPQVVCLATGSPDLLTWEKFSGNPVIAGPPAELSAVAEGQFRDPYVWREAGAWHMVMGSKRAGRGGLIVRYRSSDLRRWEYDGVLLAGDASRTEPFAPGAMWECPNFFRLGEHAVLLYSTWVEHTALAYPVFVAGSYDGEQFTPLAEGILVHGSCFYAPQVMRLADGRTILFGWLKEGRSPQAAREAGWSGVMSLPLTLDWLPAGGLRLAPAEEVKSLRRHHQHFGEMEIAAGAAEALPGVQGDCLEIEAVFEPSDAAEFGLRLRGSPDGQEQTRLVYDAARGRLGVERDQASLSPAVDREPVEAPCRLDAAGQLRLRMFLDRSVLEAFASDEACLAARLYPTRPDSLGLGVFSRQGAVRLRYLDAYSMASIWG
jgi:beta-fructofuranosidase